MSLQVSTVKEYFDTLQQRFVPAASKGMAAVFQFELAGDTGGVYHVTVNDGQMAVHQGPHQAPSATLKMAADDYVKMVNGKINGTMAFMKGQLKVSGNMVLAQKMQGVFPVSKA